MMAGMIPQATLEEIKARIDIAELIASYGVQVRQTGGAVKACCPFHHEKTPSFNIQPAKGYYHCFGCGESGDAFTFVMKQEGLTFMEAAKKLAAQCGIKIEEKSDPEAAQRNRMYQLHAELAAFFHRCLLQAREAEPARAYLASRRLPEGAVEHFKLGYVPLAPEALVTFAQKNGFTLDEMDAAGVLLKSKYANGRPYSRFAGRLVFVICDRQGRVVGFSGRILTNEKKAAKYVNSPETLVFKKSHVLFGFDRAAANIVKTPGREVIVCEGQIDLIRCHENGFGNTVASQGTAFTEEQVKMLKKVADSVMLVFDADGAGQKAAIRSGGLCLAAQMPVRVATLPAGEDPDSLLRDQGPEAFRAALAHSESITQFQIRTLRAKEANPDSIDAVARVSRAALETIRQCPVAILRASLMKEAAALLEVPLAALEEDFARLGVAPMPPPAPTPPAPRMEARPAAVAGPMPAEPDFPPEEDEAARYAALEAQFAQEEIRAAEDAAAPENNPPPPRELAFCKLLLENEQDPAVGMLVDNCVVEGLFDHPFTAAFVTAWRAGRGEAVAEWRGTLGKAEGGWLDNLLLSVDRAALSELAPSRILQDILRQLWMAAVRRIQGALPVASTPENDLRRLTLSTTIRRLQRDPWPRTVKLMVPATLT